MKAFKHAFTIAFSYDSLDPGATELNESAIRDQVTIKVHELFRNDELLEAVGAPFDTYEFTVNVYSSETGFVVDINDQLFEMSHNANMPNGVNLYIGRVHECQGFIEGLHLLSDGVALPSGLIAGIEQRLNAGGAG